MKPGGFERDRIGRETRPEHTRSALADKRYRLRRCHFRGLFHAVSNVLFSRASPAIFRQR